MGTAAIDARLAADAKLQAAVAAFNDAAAAAHFDAVAVAKLTLGPAPVEQTAEYLEAAARVAPEAGAAVYLAYESEVEAARAAHLALVADAEAGLAIQPVAYTPEVEAARAAHFAAVAAAEAGLPAEE